MKALKLQENMHHLLLLEEKDRFVHLTDNQVAIVLDEAGEQQELGGIQVTVHFPEIDQKEEFVPFTVAMAACVREFLNDPDWVKEAQSRVGKKEKKQT